MKRQLRLSAIGYYLLLSPESDGIQWRLEHFTAAGNWAGHTTCPNKADAIKTRKERYRLHERLARERVERKVRKKVEGKA